MNSKTKSAIKSLVLDLRHTLEKELAIALRYYGLFTDREWSLEAPPDRLTTPAEREVWRRMVTVIQQRMQEGRTLPEASEDYVRESAFTFLNRLVGLKCLEMRGIIDEIITTREIYGGRSQAHRNYREMHPRAARAADDALPAAIEAAFRHVNDEMIGYLFDPDDDHSLVWPRYAVLKRCIAMINGLDAAAWREDEIIGWIYQFYNAEEKVEVRDRGKPQTPHDVAVINQFFTPRWIVKFLVDNTLGRLWLEMHPDSERVRAKCDYLVPEPHPSPTSAASGDTPSLSRPSGEGEGQGEDEGFALDPDSPINTPAAAPRRDEKPLTQIKLLDPACGTMHFGHYAMEVFAAMYRDARDWGHVQIAEHEIPGVILKNNLFGVDIDRRAVQLAALSLFMKARTMHAEASVSQVNLVAADATLPDSDVREAFLARYAKAPKVQRAFAQVLADMDQVAELGSLLRVEERLRELLAEAGHAAAREALRGLDPRRQREIPGMEAPRRQIGLAELADDEEQAAAWTPHYTLRELRDDLRAFARRALDEHDLNAQLFATEADKAVRLLDVLMGEFDVVVMNPPYGETMEVAKDYLGKTYSETKNDLYAAFIDRGLDLIGAEGYIGALVSRTFMFLSSFTKFREQILLALSHIISIAELGLGVLDDATVRPAAIVLSKTSDSTRTSALSTFFRLPQVELDEKATTLMAAIRQPFQGRKDGAVFISRPSHFTILPKSPFTYWAPENVLELFLDLPPLDKDNLSRHTDKRKVADVKEGLGTRDDARFVRYFWEVDLASIGNGWYLFAKGGECLRYYKNIDWIVYWGDDGKSIKQNIVKKYPYLDGNYSWLVKHTDYYFQEGTSYTRESGKASLGVYHMPEGCIFADKGPAIFFHDTQDLWWGMGLANSALMAGFLRMLTPDRSRPIGLVSSLPIAIPRGSQKRILERTVKTIYQTKASWDTGNEISTRFTAPWLLQLAQPESDAFAQGLGRVLELLGDDAPALAQSPPHPLTLSALLDRARAIERAADARLQRLQAEIDAAVYDLYEISPQDRALIERELGDRPPELVWPQMERKSEQAKREEHVKRFFSYYARQAVREDDDGIVPLAGCAAREPTLMARIRARLEAAFGSATAYNLEQEAAAYVGRDLETQLHTYFFHHVHVKLYQKRPVLWHLTSDKKHFAVMLDYHRIDRDTLPKVRARYLWPQMEEVRARLAGARAHEDANISLINALEEELEDLQAFEERLETVIEGTVKVRLSKWAVGPYRDGKPPYDPDLDDGVKVNLLPIQKARLLPIKKVV
jgi:hypothetical protein